MKRRPIPVAIIGCAYIVMGTIGVAYHLTESRAPDASPYELLWIEALRITAIVCGVFLLRGANWARWLAVTWMGYHVILSAFHTASEFAIHGLLCAVLAYFLFRTTATGYFRGARG